MSIKLYFPEKPHSIAPIMSKKAKAEKAPAGEQKTDLSSFNIKAFMYLCNKRLRFISAVKLKGNVS